VLTGQGEVETHPVPRDGEAVARPALRENHGEESQEASDEVHILDYVMHDFAFPKRSRSYR
jgi:hypothetical protein